MRKTMFFVMLVVSALAVIFLIKTVLPNFPQKIDWPSHEAIADEAEKYNTCQYAKDCGVFLYRSACKWYALPLNINDLHRMEEYQKEWRYSKGGNDCPDYKPQTEGISDCERDRCVLTIEIQ